MGFLRNYALILGLLLVPVIVSAIPDFSGLPPGPYCARNQKCCDSRVDECSVPILGTLCYCDEFCNRNRSEDCCPDYWTVCKGAPAPIMKGCTLNGRYFIPGQSILENCNLCKCEVINGEADLLCERDACIIDEKQIESINDQSFDLGWSAYNYSDLWGHKLDDGITRKLGTLQPHRSVMRMNPVRRIYDPNSLPKYFDASEKWPGWVSEVQDQGWCGSSWAISTAAVASDRLAIMSKGMERAKLSAQHLLACNNRGQQSCQGGYLDRAWLFFRKFGVVDEKCYPYKAVETKCPFPKKGNLQSARCKPDVPTRTDYYKTGPAYRLGNETDIMYEIMESGPVQATLKVYQDFFVYKNGIYKLSSRIPRTSQNGYHSVRIVGWGEETSVYPPQKYWKVANSWGPHWGEYGYFRIAKGVNEVEIESYVLGAWARTADRLDNNTF